VILANHGTVSFGETVEKAYWWTEILDAYCRILMLAKDLGRVTYLTKQETKELLDLKAKWGYTDPRLEKDMENCDICANDVFRSSWGTTGVDRKAFDAPPPMGADPENATRATIPAALGQEDLVKIVTETVCRQLGIKLSA
jgi:L-fuculose-phosphate aldolase